MDSFLMNDEASSSCERRGGKKKENFKRLGNGEKTTNHFLVQSEKRRERTGRMDDTSLRLGGGLLRRPIKQTLDRKTAENIQGRKMHCNRLVDKSDFGVEVGRRGWETRERRSDWETNGKKRFAEQKGEGNLAKTEDGSLS